MKLLSVFLAVADSSGIQMPIIMGLIILVFWLFFIRPQAKKAKEQKEQINKLQKGDKVVTIAGIHGTVSKVNDDGTMHVEVAPGTHLKIEKSTVSSEWTANINKPAETTETK